MARGREKETASAAEGDLMSSEKLAEELPPESEEETSSESEPDEEYIELDDDMEDKMAAAEWWSTGPAAQLGNGGVILVLFETPSGFALFSYDGVKLLQPNACQDIWADFVNGSVAKRVVSCLTFEPFKDKSIAIDQHTGVSEMLTRMITKRRAPEQKLVVGDNYKEIIEDHLGISCLCCPAVEELMWGLTIQLGNFVPAKDSGLTNEDRLPMSEGMKSFLKSHSFEVEPDMMVTRNIIEMAGRMYECDRCVRKHEISLRSAGKYIKEISQIDTEDWDLLKLATALMIICCPEEKIKPPRSLFSREQLQIFREHAHKYENKIFKMPLMVVYNEIYWARKLRYKVGGVLIHLFRQAKMEYEAKQPREGTCGMKIHPGVKPATIDELTKYETMITAERKKRQVPPTLAPATALKRYAWIFSCPLHRNKPGILSMDIHPLKDIIAAGGIDKNAVLFNRPSGQILCTLTGHSKKITSLKFLNRDELLVTGSADKTVRIWQGSEDRSYSCIHTLNDHTAEVKAVTVHPTQKYFVTASKDNTWCFYDTSTGSCLTQVGEASGKEGYTSASFHPDGLVLGTGTTDAVVKIWDVKTQSIVAKFEEHVGTVTAMSFSENGYFLATAALDGVKLWDLRKLKSFSTLAPYDSGIPTNAVEFDYSGSYLAIGGSDVRVYQVANVTANWNGIKKLPDLSGTGKVTSVKFGTDAKYIAVGSMDRKLRIFGLRSCQSATQDITVIC